MKLTIKDLSEWLFSKLPPANPNEALSDTFTFGKAVITYKMIQGLKIDAIKEELAKTCLKEPFERFLKQYDELESTWKISGTTVITSGGGRETTIMLNPKDFTIKWGGTLINTRPPLAIKERAGVKVIGSTEKLEVKFK